MKCFLFLALLATSIVVGGSQVAAADLILDLQFDDSTTSKSVASGSTVFVDMFLSDTDGSTAMAADGLVSGGGRLIQTAGTATVSPGAVTGHPSGTFTGMFTTPAGGGGGLGTALATALPFTSVGVGSTSVFIARFTLTISGALGETATLGSEVLGGGFTGNQTGPGSFSNLDTVLAGIGPGGFGTVDVSIDSAAVPEASSLLVAALLGMGAWYRRQSRIRISQKVDAPVK